MCLDDRTADSQPQAHAAVLGREEAVEQTRGVLRRDPRSTVLNRAAQGDGVLRNCADGDVAPLAFGLRHCLHGVHGEVNDHLLQLRTIPRPCADPLQFSGISSGPQGQTMSQAGTLSLSVRCSHSVCFVRHLTRDPVRRPTPALDPITVMWSEGILSCAKGPVAACQAVKLFEMQLANGVRDWRLVLH